MSTELLGTSAVIRTFGNCGPPDPPWPSALSSELSAATGTPPNCAAAVCRVPPPADEVGLLELPRPLELARPLELPRPPELDEMPPVNLCAAVIAFTPEEGAISFVADSAEASP